MDAWKNKRKVMYAYDVTAEIYDARYAAEQKAKYRKTLENLEVNGERVLDVGCGSGLFFCEVSAKAEMTVGVDVSRKFLREAKKQAAPAKNVAVIQADADYLPFKNGVFGGVFAFTVLQNMPNPANTLSELKRVTRSGGKIAVTGLKKAFTLQKFMDIVEDSGMTVTAFIDDEALNCYIAVLAA